MIRVALRWPLLLAAGLLCLSACGGGGGSSRPPPTPPDPPPVAQTIVFAMAGPIAKIVGDAPFTNAASGGAGTGAITYSSGNPAVATVGTSSGTVTVIGAGGTVIIANKTASTGFLAATATYTLNVVAPPPAPPVAQNISFSAPGPITRTYGDAQFTNTASGGAGTGAISYSSHTTAVASVDTTTGLVTIVGAGTALITASKAASSGYLAASANFTLDVLRAAQTIAFQNTGPFAKRPGDSPMVNLASGGNGNGAITYSSSDTSVATVVASTGSVRFRAAGATTITANKAQSANHLAASATYLINVYSPALDELTAWIGDDDTEVQFPPGAVGAEFMRTDLAGCHTNILESCSLTPVSTLSSANVLDTETETYSAGVYALRRSSSTTRRTLIEGSGYFPTYDNEVVEESGTLWSLNFNLAVINYSNDGRAWTAASPAMPYGSREGAAAAGFNNRIWVVGGDQLEATGASPTLGEKGDVFEIDPHGGSGFVTTNAAFGPRKYHRVVSFNGRLWLVGGQRGATPAYLNDVWSSTDGSTWTLATAAAPFAPRAEHALAVFNGRLWVIAGRNGSGYLRDVWSTADGSTWRSESSFGNYGRAGHRAVVLNDRLYVVGKAQYADNIVHSSADGVTWQAHNSAWAPELTRAAVVPFKDRLWTFGGRGWDTGSCCARGEVWSTSDADNWRFESLGAPYSSMPGARMVEFNGELFLNASSSWQTSLYHKPYKTSDASHWVKAEPPMQIMTQLYARSESALLTFNNRLWVLGGRSLDPGSYHVVWGDSNSTGDGSTWTWNNQTAFMPRYGHSGYVIGGRMFVLGGYNDMAEQLGDIQSTANGTSWRTDVATVTNIGLRSYHETVVFNNRVWLLGGEKGGTSVTGEIWSSADGIAWQLEASNEPATTRQQFGAVVWNGRIWVVGGKDAAGNVVSDVWSSADGVNWRLETSSAVPTPRARMALAVFNNRLYMFGGESTRPEDEGRGINEMWSSADGVTWRRLYRNDIEVP